MLTKRRKVSKKNASAARFGVFTYNNIVSNDLPRKKKIPENVVYFTLTHTCCKNPECSSSTQASITVF